ncbi:hypothetical protein L6452_36578 [Arctium lappa]|uniref:Uncharacterized protein n=1 Tax=Arctium lappa TaxID=4217 RepID=A0ACB8YAQ2_ARCLA|nr:hypothetical protein L6452_36578 [Arctium lappa]
MEPNQSGSWWSGYNNIQSVWKLVEEKPSPSSARTRIQPNTKTIEAVSFTFSKSGQFGGLDMGSRIDDQLNSGVHHLAEEEAEAAGGLMRLFRLLEMMVMGWKQVEREVAIERKKKRRR